MVAEAFSGFPNSSLDHHDSTPKRVALPAVVASRLAQLALVTPVATVRLRLTAVVAQKFMCRRSQDVLSLAAADILFLPDAGLSFQVRRTTCDARKPRGERLAHTNPRSPCTTEHDHSILLLLRALAEHDSRSPPAARLSPAPPGDAGTTLTAWKSAGLQMLGVASHVGTLYASHFYCSGGCTALISAGLGLDAIYQWQGMAKETLTKSYNDALVAATPEAHFFFGRLRPRELPLPT